MKTSKAAGKVAIIYPRTSKDDKDDPRLSIGSQDESGRRKAKELGYSVLEVVKDIGLSASLPPTRWLTGKPTALNHRPGLDRVLALLESGKADTLIVWRRDRLSRNLELSLKLFRWLSERNITLVGVAETAGLDSSASGQLQLQIMSSVAEYQLAYTTENVRRAKERQRENGMKMGPVWTVGYAEGKESGTVEVVPEAVEVVKEIYRRYIAGDSVSAIVRWLRVDHPSILPGNRNRWYNSAVTRCLTNPYYVGMTSNGAELIPSKVYTPIIDNATWNHAQELRKVRRNPKHGKRVAEHLLGGFLTCGYCGHTLTVSSRFNRTTHERNGFEYKCVNPACDKVPFTMREFLWDEWANVMFDVNPIVEPETNGDTVKLRTDIEKLHKKLADLEKAYSDPDGDIDIGTFSRVKRELETKMRTTEAELNRAAAGSGMDLMKSWDMLTTEEKRVLLSKVLKGSVQVYHDRVEYEKRAGTLPVWWPLQHRHVEGHKSVRRFNCLLPQDGIKAVMLRKATIGGRSYFTPAFSAVVKAAGKPAKAGKTTGAA